MSKVIYKYGPLMGYNKVPVKGKIVHAEYCEIDTFTTQEGIYVWSEVDLSEGVTQPEYMIDFVVTGEPFTGKYHKTVRTPIDGVVCHVVEL